MIALDLFSGIGGFSYAGKLVWGNEYEIIHFVEFDKYCQELLKLRFPGVPIHSDIKDFDGREYRGTIDLITGGFPCQSFSTAGKRRGTEDDRYLWSEMFRVIRDVKPRWVVAENVFGLINWNEGLVLEAVLSDLETEGYETQTYILPACAVNAVHRRDRVWMVAHSEGNIRRASGNERSIAPNGSDSDAPDTTITGQQEPEHIGDSENKAETRTGMDYRLERYDSITPNTNGQGLEGQQSERGTSTGGRFAEYDWDDSWVEVATSTCVRGVDDGLSVSLHGFELSKSRHRVERLRALGNAIVPQVAIPIFKAIKEYDGEA